MKFTSRSLALVIILLTAIYGPSTRADSKKGEKAFRSGDYVTALRELKPLAEHGNSEAQFRLGQMYKLGLGVSRDFSQAVIWYWKAAEQGHIGAQHNMGGAFYTGKGASQDYTEAARWYRKAADGGHVMSQFNLGLMYARGEGVPSDDVQAYKWFFLAASRAPLDKYQHRMARDLFALSDRMTLDQIAEAKRLIVEWLVKFRKSHRIRI